MSELDALIGRARQPGTFVERRRFTLAQDKAIEKMRSFALRDPDQFARELVAGAILLGARFVSLEVSGRDLILAWIGGTLPAEAELDRLFDYLFIDQGRADSRALIQLAVGVNGLLRLKPSSVRIESGDGRAGRGLALALNGAGEGSVGRTAEAIEGSIVVARLPLLGRRFPSGVPIGVRDHALYAPAMVIVNGQYCNAGARDVQGRLGVGAESDGRRAWNLHPSHQDMVFGLMIVVGGMWVCDRDLPELSHGGVGLHGVVLDDGLRKSADYGDVVEDRRFLEMRHAIRPALVRLRGELGALEPLPELPPLLPSEPEGGGQVRRALQAEPLPDMLQAPAPRPPLPARRLEALQDEGPLFYVERAEGALLRALDPLRFPWRVLVLTPGQALSLAERAPAHPPQRLATVADAEFVARALSRELSLASVLLDWPEGPPGAGVTMRLHGLGPQPAIGDPRDGDLPILLCRDGVSVAVHRTSVGLPHMSLVVELPGRPGAPLGIAPDEALPLLGRRAAMEAWRLVVGATGPNLRSFVVALIARGGVPRFVRGAAALSVELGFPPAWGSCVETLRQTPLAETEQGPLNLARLEAAMGTDAVFTLTDPADLSCLEPLEAALGFAHLTTVSPGSPLTGVGWRGFWRMIREPSKVFEEGFSALLLVGADLGPGPCPTGWRRGPALAPGVVSLLIEHTPWPGRWSDGLQLLLQRLTALNQEIGASERPVHGRVAARLRHALLGVAAKLDSVPGLHLFLRPAASGPPDPLSSLGPCGPLRVSACHREALADPSTRHLSLDELKIVEAALGPSKLTTDDPAALWLSLSDVEAPQWLLRAPVVGAGVRGMLGLRVPFDPTPAILWHGPVGFLKASGASAEAAERLRCHGLLWVDEEASLPAALDLARLVRMRMATELVRLLDTEPAGPRREVATAHAVNLVSGALQDGPALPAALRQLSERVSVAAPAPPPAEVAPTPRAEQDAFKLLADRLGAAMGVETPRLSLESGLVGGPPFRWEDLYRVGVVLSRSHPMVVEALRGSGRALELLLVQLAVSTALHDRQVGEAPDVEAWLRALALQRVAAS